MKRWTWPAITRSNTLASISRAVSMSIHFLDTLTGHMVLSCGGLGTETFVRRPITNLGSLDGECFTLRGNSLKGATRRPGAISSVSRLRLLDWPWVAVYLQYIEIIALSKMQPWTYSSFDVYYVYIYLLNQSDYWHVFWSLVVLVSFSPLAFTKRRYTLIRFAKPWPPGNLPI